MDTSVTIYWRNADHEQSEENRCKTAAVSVIHLLQSSSNKQHAENDTDSKMSRSHFSVSLRYALSYLSSMSHQFNNHNTAKLHSSSFVSK